MANDYDSANMKIHTNNFQNKAEKENDSLRAMGFGNTAEINMTASSKSTIADAKEFVGKDVKASS